FFDVGDTLVEGWIGPERTNALTRAVLQSSFAGRSWHEQFLAATIAPARSPDLPLERAVQDDTLRQETLRWYREWFINAKIGIDDVDLDKLRIAMTIPLDLVSTPVPGAFDAVRWCKA